MPIPIYQVDAFLTDKPFSGNPAAVCILAKPAGETWMHQVAMEMNLSETAFLVKQSHGYDLRWFTPVTEVDLCGHATLASAHVLWETGLLKPEEEALFHTRSGVLTAAQNADLIELDFPATPEEPAIPPPGLIESLNIQPLYTGKNVYDYIIEVGSEETVRDLQPDFERLKSLQARGVVVTSRSSHPSYDFVSRFFGPGSGIAEDPVTGSAHCCLGPYWMKRLNKKELVAYQASRRGGLLYVRVGDGRVFIAGKAVTVMRGELL